MTGRRLLLLVLLTAAALASAGADQAHACSCADVDPRDRIEEGAPAVIGRVVAATPGDPQSPARHSSYVVRVQRALNVRLGKEMTVLNEEFTSCAFAWRVGQRVGAFLHRTRGGWTTNLCSLSTAGELERATRPYPRAVGRGRLALLAGGNFGDARLIALDPRGRILGYGFGDGAVRRISVCPGGRVAAELFDRGRRRTLVAVRSLESLRVVSRAEVPRHTTDLVCADAAGATVFAAGIDYRGRPARGRGEVRRVAGSASRRVSTRPAEQLVLGPDAAYAWSGGRILSIALSDDAERPLLRMGQAHHVVPSPFGGQLAVQGFDGRLRLVDLATGAVATRRLESEAWAFAWLGPDRLLARIGGAAVVLDGQLRSQRRYSFARAFHQAPFEDGVFGIERYRLVRLDLESGNARAAARLPDRGIAELVGVAGGPEVELPRRAPRVTPAGAGAARRLCP